MSDTQYRIYCPNRIGWGRSYVSSAWVDSLGIASYSWIGNPKGARLFDSAEIAANMAAAIQKTIADRGYGKVELLIAPRTGGHNKSTRWV